MVALRWLVLSICLFGCLTCAANACLWDSDTLQQEQSRFPSALELITGKFSRHTREFYEWRNPATGCGGSKMTRIIPALADDLAAAYDKTGRDDKAIAVMLDVERKSPGRHETAAKLGTFYIHAGRYQEGLRQLERAIRINPNAHFRPRNLPKAARGISVGMPRRGQGSHPALNGTGPAVPEASRFSSGVANTAQRVRARFLKFRRQAGVQHRNESRSRESSA